MRGNVEIISNFYLPRNAWLFRVVWDEKYVEAYYDNNYTPEQMIEFFKKITTQMEMMIK